MKIKPKDFWGINQTGNKNKRKTKRQMIEEMVDKAYEDDRLWMILEEEVLGQTKCDWLASELERFDEYRLEVIYEQYFMN